jgi:hypothetical protein
VGALAASAGCALDPERAAKLADILGAFGGS